MIIIINIRENHKVSDEKIAISTLTLSLIPQFDNLKKKLETRTNKQEVLDKQLRKQKKITFKQCMECNEKC